MLFRAKDMCVSLRTDTIVKPKLNGSGYYDVKICGNNGSRKTINLHILIAKTFLEKPESDKRIIVDHINGIKTDNCLENLRYITDSGNAINARKNNKNYKNFHKKLYKIIQQFDTNGKFIHEYKSLQEASEKTGILSTGISQCCHGHYQTAGGFVWRYKKPPKKILHVDEIFKPIPAINGHKFTNYKISNYGTVKNIKTGKYLAPISSEAYLRVQLYTDERKKKIPKIHRLVALTFLDKPNGKNVVNHKDKDKRNNYYQNLE